MVAHIPWCVRGDGGGAEGAGVGVGVCRVCVQPLSMSATYSAPCVQHPAAAAHC